MFKVGFEIGSIIAIANTGPEDTFARTRCVGTDMCESVGFVEDEVPGQ